MFWIEAIAIDCPEAAGVFSCQFSNLIASVTDPYTRTAHFYYDSSGRLTNIVDMIGMSTTFQYDGSDNIISMATPYGTTGFQYLTGISTNINYTNTLRRSVLITEPSGDHQLYSYCDNGPYGVASDGYPYYRNSYHWNRAQYAAIPVADRANVLDMPGGTGSEQRISTA